MRRRPYGALMEPVMRSLRASADEEARLARILELMDAESGTPEGAELDRLTNDQMKAERGWRSENGEA